MIGVELGGKADRVMEKEVWRRPRGGVGEGGNATFQENRGEGDASMPEWKSVEGGEGRGGGEGGGRGDGEEGMGKRGGESGEGWGVRWRKWSPIGEGKWLMRMFVINGARADADGGRARAREGDEWRRRRRRRRRQFKRRCKMDGLMIQRNGSARITLMDHRHF